MNISLSIRHFMAETYGTFVVVFLVTLTYVLFVSENLILILLACGGRSSAVLASLFYKPLKYENHHDVA